MTNRKKLLILFFYSMKISAFTFGGGYVIVSLMKKLFVDKLGWISEREMLDFTAIAQSSPGAVAVNGSVLVGNKTMGFAGAITAVGGTVLPPLVLLAALSYIYEWFIGVAVIRAAMTGMQAGVIAIIADVTISMLGTVFRESRWIAVITAAVTLSAVTLFSVNVILPVLIFAVLGIVLYGRKGSA